MADGSPILEFVSIFVSIFICIYTNINKLIYIYIYEGFM